MTQALAFPGQDLYKHGQIAAANVLKRLAKGR